jgi:hypothetical protein
MLIENTIFRAPVSLGGRDVAGTYDVRFWDRRAKLPIGHAAMLSWAVGIPCITAGMAQTWWVGWVAERIEGGKGDIGFILGFCACSLVFLPARCVFSACLHAIPVRRADLLFSSHHLRVPDGPSGGTPAGSGRPRETSNGSVPTHLSET